MSRPPSIAEEILETLPETGAGRAEARRGGLRVCLKCRDTDRLGVLVEALELDPIPAQVDAGELRRRLRELASRIDYLSEPLRLVEHDPARTGALLRSAEPRRSGAGREYFELRVERTRRAAFTRYHQPPGAADRSPSPFLLDRSTLARLIDDLAAALGA